MVEDNQGQPVNGVPVTFRVPADWQKNARVVPNQVMTQDGTANASFDASMPGVVMVTVRRVTPLRRLVSRSPAMEVVYTTRSPRTYNGLLGTSRSLASKAGKAPVLLGDRGSAMAIAMISLVQYCSSWTVRSVALRLPRHSHWGTLCYTDARQGHRQTSLSLSRAI